MFRKHYNTISILLISLPYPIGKITTITMISVRKFLRICTVYKNWYRFFPSYQDIFFCAILQYVRVIPKYGNEEFLVTTQGINFRRRQNIQLNPKRAKN